MDLKHVEAFAAAIANAMRHPDPAAWAKEVVGFFEGAKEAPAETTETDGSKPVEATAAAAPAEVPAEAAAAATESAPAAPAESTAQPV